MASDAVQAPQALTDHRRYPVVALYGSGASSMTSTDALKFVKKHGVVLEAGRGPVPNLAEEIAGQPIKGSWWSHPKGREIFRLTRIVRDSPDVLTCRLIEGKITFVHRRLWPALVSLADHLGTQHLAALREEHTRTGAHRVTSVPFPFALDSRPHSCGGDC
jgi:hypothetical protein